MPSVGNTEKKNMNPNSSYLLNGGQMKQHKETKESMDTGFIKKPIIVIIWLMKYFNVDKRIVWQMVFPHPIKILQS